MPGGGDTLRGGRGRRPRGGRWRREDEEAREDEMPEDLVCKFPRCISVGFWRDPWRINGPARMKGRGGKRHGESFLSLSRESILSPDVFLSLSLSSRSRQFHVLSLRFFHSPLSLSSLSHLAILSERSTSVQPPNKRTDRVYSRGRERLWTGKKRRNRASRQRTLLLLLLLLHLLLLSSLVLFSARQRNEVESGRIPRNASMPRRSDVSSRFAP